MKKQLMVACVLILCIAIFIVILSCGNKMNSYIGNTYEGATPWGNELAISVNGCDGSSVRFELEEGLSSNFKVKNEYEGSIINDNTLILHNSGEITENNESIQYEYSRKLKFVNG